MLPTDEDPPYTSNVVPISFALSEGSGRPMAGVTTSGMVGPETVLERVCTAATSAKGMTTPEV